MQVNFNNDQAILEAEKAKYVIKDSICAFENDAIKNCVKLICEGKKACYKVFSGRYVVYTYNL